MKTDAEVRLMMRERAKGKTQNQAAARAGMSVRTARAYEQAGKLPGQMKEPRTHRTRPDPFTEDWLWIEQQLQGHPRLRWGTRALQGTTLCAVLTEQHPGRYTATQVRTLQRHIAAWRATSGPEQEVIFPQVHDPGQLAQSDFTHMTDLGITIAGSSFPHLVFHLAPRPRSVFQANALNR